MFSSINMHPFVYQSCKPFLFICLFLYIFMDNLQKVVVELSWRDFFFFLAHIFQISVYLQKHLNRLLLCVFSFKSTTLSRTLSRTPEVLSNLTSDMIPFVWPMLVNTFLKLPISEIYYLLQYWHYKTEIFHSSQ